MTSSSFARREPRSWALCSIAALAVGAGVMLSCARGVDPALEEAGIDDVVGAEAMSCSGTSCTLPNATVSNCVDNECIVGTCSPGYADIDHLPQNGCECALGNYGNACNMATDQGTLAAGMMHTIMGVLPMAGHDHWFKVTFGPGGHPSIRMGSAAGNANVHFDVMPACGTPMGFTCPDRSAGPTGITVWEFFDNPNDAGVAVQGDAGFDPDGGIGPGGRMTAFPTVAYIHMYVQASATPNCMPYQLLISN